ncbi:MAG: hypothetical protein ABI778_05440, partial [Ignavibacteriota bacterium]
MKSFFGFVFLFFFASHSLAQDQPHQPLPQADTTSGWQLVFSNPHYGFGKLAYFKNEANICYAYGGNGITNILFRSTDKGITWDSIAPVPFGIITFTTSMIGYSVPSSPHIVWKTTNGGQTWIAHDRKSVADGPIAFADKDTGLVFGASRTARTTDGGETWAEL